MKHLRCFFVLVCLFILVLYRTDDVKAADSLHLKIGEQESTYNGKQVSVMLDGTAINLGNSPGIYKDGLALLPYDTVFKEGLAATCSYNSLTGTVVVKQFGNTVKMTLNKKTAYVNGAKKTLGAAPIKVYYYADKTTKILLPARFVAEALGYTYHWNSSNATVRLTAPYALYYNSAWHLYKGTKGQVRVNGGKVNVSTLPTVIFNNVSLVQARKVFHDAGLGTTYSYNAKSKKVVIKKGSNSVTYILNSKTAYINGKKSSLTVPARLMKDNKTKKSYVMVPARFTATSLGMKYAWNSTSKASCFAVPGSGLWAWKSTDSSLQSDAVYSNLILSGSLVRSGTDEVVTFKTVNHLETTTSYNESSRIITIQVSNVNNSFETFTNALGNSNSIDKIKAVKCNNGCTTITLHLKSSIEFYYASTDTSYSVVLTNTNSILIDSGKITLKKPDSLDFDSISDLDCYYNKQFKLILEGDYTDYYSNVSIPSDSSVKKVTATLNANKNTVLTFTTSSIQGYKISLDGDYIIVTVGDPKEIYDAIVVLDAGHGGKDPGAIGNGYYEKNFNFNILYKYAKQYFNDEDSPVKAYWTRTSDTYITLANRAAFAKKVDADIFISMHMNSAGASAHGAESYYCKSNNSVNSFGVSSQTLASYFQSNWPSKIGIDTSRGIKTANYYVLKHNTVPATLVELGFISNSNDAKTLGTVSNQKKAAKYFYNAVCSFFDKYPTGR